MQESLSQMDLIVYRSRVNAMLEQGIKYPLTTILAGPGYGKTTAVKNFCADYKGNVLWLHLLRVDNDVNRFWSNLLFAMKPQFPQLYKDFSKLGFPDTAAKFDLFLRLIVKYRTEEEILLVLDNFELIENPIIHDFLNSTIQAELEGISVIYISSTPIKIQDYFLESKQYRINIEDLQLNEEEISELFRYYGKQLSTTEVKRLNETTDGWPMALNLIASQSLKENQIRNNAALYQERIDDFFEQRYFDIYEDEYKELLIKLSFFHNIPLRLIQEIDVYDSMLALDYFKENMFILYDYEKELFYFQKMYHSFLSRKQGLISREKMRETYLSLGTWYHSNHYFIEALECFWELSDYNLFLDTVINLPRIKSSRGTSNWILSKLNQFPSDYLERKEELEFSKAFMYFNDMKVRKAKELFLSVIEQLEKKELTEQQKQLLGDTYAVMIDIEYAQNNLKALEYAEKAATILPNGTTIRSEELLVVGNNDTFFLPDNEAGALERAKQFNWDFVKYGDRIYQSKSGFGFQYLFAAETAYFEEKFVELLEYCSKAIYIAKDANQHDIVANAMYLQIRSALYLGDYIKAEMLLKDLDIYLEQNSVIQLTNLYDCAKALFYLGVEEPNKVPIWLTEIYELQSDIPMDMGRDRMTYAMYCLVSGRYEKTYSILFELDEYFLERRLWSIQFSSSILKAIALLKLKREEKAIEALWHAYQITYQNKIIICFAEFGKQIVELLDLIANQSIYSFDPVWVEEVRNSAIQYQKRKDIMLRQYKKRMIVTKEKKKSNLTNRELEILSYLTLGYTREDIAKALSISIHGVKKHISNIYSKLGAINRVDAVYIAISEGLVDCLD